MMFSQSDEIGIFDVLEIKIVTAQPSWAAFERIFSKLFLWILHFGVAITVTLMRKEKK